MSDWQVGDLALCLYGGRWVTWGSGGEGPSPQRGAIYKVDRISLVGGLVGLWIEGFTHDCFEASEFRKIKPDTHEPCEEEFRILLQLSKKRVKA